jgi:hypothetical protein
MFGRADHRSSCGRLPRERGLRGRRSAAAEYPARQGQSSDPFCRPFQHSRLDPAVGRRHRQRRLCKSHRVQCAQHGRTDPECQTSPTFDVGTLDSQDFTKGLLSEIDPRIIKTLFDQGIDPRIMMLLFFSEYRNYRSERFINNFACDRSHPIDAERGCLNRVQDYLHEIDSLIASKGLPQQLQANVYEILSPIGGKLSGSWSLKDNLADLRQLDTTKYKLIGKRLYSISQPLLAICHERNHRLYPLFDQSVTGTDSSTKSEVIVEHPSRANYSLWVRSTYDMLQFL